MKTSFLLVVLTILLDSFLYGQSLNSFESKKMRNGLYTTTKIDSAVKISYRHFLVENDSLYNDPFRGVEEYFYNSGQLEKVIFRNPLTDSISLVYFFDNQERIMGQVRFGENVWWPFISYHYDEQSLVTSEVCFDSDSNIVEQTIIHYNKEIKPIRKEEYRNDSVLTRYWTYKYNHFGDLVEELYTNTPEGPGITLGSSITGGPDEFTPWPNDTILYKLKYDSENRVTERIKYSNSEIESRTTLIEVPGDTNIVTIVEYSGIRKKPRKLTTTTKIDSLSVVLQQSVSSEGKVNAWFKSTYLNEQLQEYESDWYGHKHYFYKTNYDYDNRGNWIKKTRFENKKKISIVERIIEYK